MAGRRRHRPAPISADAHDLKVEEGEQRRGQYGPSEDFGDARYSVRVPTDALRQVIEMQHDRRLTSGSLATAPLEEHTARSVGSDTTTVTTLLEQIYSRDGLSFKATAQRVGAITPLVPAWLPELEIPDDSAMRLQTLVVGS